jgi:Putative serine esterase (DUF676)
MTAVKSYWSNRGTNGMQTMTDFKLEQIAKSNGVGDVIFVHGLVGDLFKTWSVDATTETEGGLWLRWIAKDIPELNVYTLGYPSSIFAKWAAKEMTLYERAKASLDYLSSMRIGEKPVAFVCHSLGGLLVKQILRTGIESSNEEWKAIATNCRWVSFLATPHTGSSVASVMQFSFPNLASNFIELLRSDSSQLDELNDAYRRFAPRLGIKTSASYEMHKTKLVALVVEKKDADPGVFETETVPVDADHISICKPSDRQQPIYLSTKHQLLRFSGAAAEINTKGKQEARGILSDIVSHVTAGQEEQSQKSTSTINVESANWDFGAARRKALSGKWKGRERQLAGPNGVPIDYDVYLEIKQWKGAVAEGEYRFCYRDENRDLDEKMPFEGGFIYNRFLRLSYEDYNSGKLQCGILLLELSEDGKVLKGTDVGFGYTTRSILTAETLLYKQKE